MDDVVICAIIKQEHAYLQEWVDYHIKLGVGHFYLYDNDEEQPHSLPEKYREKVTFIPHHGPVQQMICYNYFIFDYRGKHEWAAFIDVDEFIVLKQHDNIKDFLGDYPHVNALALNWVLFGSSGLECKDERGVLQRFVMRQRGVNPHVKVICRLSQTIAMPMCHTVRLRRGETRDCKGNIVHNEFNPLGDDSIACLNHYFTKSKQEFHEKCARGRADLHIPRSVHEFHTYDLNEVKDFTALHFFCKP